MTLRREFRRKLEESCPTAICITKWCEKICQRRFHLLGEILRPPECECLNNRFEVPGSLRRRVNREWNVQQTCVCVCARACACARVVFFSGKPLDPRPCLLQMLQHIIPNDRVLQKMTHSCWKSFCVEKTYLLRGKVNRQTIRSGRSVSFHAFY